MDALLAYISYHPVQRWGPIVPNGVAIGAAALALGYAITRTPGEGATRALGWVLAGAAAAAATVYVSFAFLPEFGSVSPHGVGTAGGFLAGAMIMAWRAEPQGIPRQEVYNAVTWGAIGAIIGARGFYVLGHLDQFRSLQDVISVWEGGLTMFGGFAGGLVLGLGYLHRRGYHVPTALDAAAPGFVVGVLIGRIGDLIIADHLGNRTDFFLGYRVPRGADMPPGYGPPFYVEGGVYHQTAMYDLVGVLFLLGGLALLARRRPATGTLFAVFALWYGLQRFVVDFTRNTDVIESVFFGLSGSQWAGLAFAAGGAAALVRIGTRRPAPAEPEEEVPQPESVPTAWPPPLPPSPQGPSGDQSSEDDSRA